MRWFGESSSRRSLSARPQLELLEDRVVPSATILDLTSRGASGAIGDGLFVQTSERASTRGEDTFLSMHHRGFWGNQTEQGYNTDARPQFDEVRSRRLTHALKLKDVPTVTIDGTKYREFRLDISEAGLRRTSGLLSLDELRIYQSNRPRLSGYDADTKQLGGVDALYDLDADGDHFVKLDGRLGRWNGNDALVYIKDSLFSGGSRSHVFLYSKFGENYGADLGCESWAVKPVCEEPPQGGGTISGVVFNDDDDSGDFTEGESVLPGWTVFIDTNDNGTLDSGELSTTTNDQGQYTFTNLPTGQGEQSTYRLRLQVQFGWLTTGDPAPVELTEPDQVVTGVNLGVIQGFGD